MLFDSNIQSIRLSKQALYPYIRRISNVLIFVMDANDAIVDCNAYALKTLRFNRDELVGSSIHSVVAFSKPLNELKAAFYLDGGADEDVRLTIVAKDNQRISASLNMMRVELEDGEGHVLLLQDTRQFRELSLLQQFAGTFMRDVNLGVLLIDTDFSLVDISDMACRLLGLNRELSLNKSLEEVFAFVPVEHQLVQRTLLDGAVVRNHAVSWMNNQDRYELLLDSNLLKDQDGVTVGACVIFKDVTNLRSLEEQVQRSDRLAMIGQIAAGTAHEIRNPLTSIKGFLQMFKKTLQDKGMEKEQGYADIMLTEINRINELVSEFLLLSKPKNVTFDLVDVSSVLQDIMPIINNEALLHGVMIFNHSGREMPLVVADRELLKQVFLNICKNGIEAMVDGGTLTISEKVDTEYGNKVNIEIHDTGPGIPSFLIDKIFDPFFTTKQNGTGLGLSVCQRIIHDIGGSIRVSSKGFGTTFTVSIPFSDN